MKAIFIFLMPFAFLHAQHVGVFCGSDESIPDGYKTHAFELGKSLAQAGYGLTTGGASSGLMNAVVNGFVSVGNPENMRGIIPALFKPYKVHHPQIPEGNLIWTETVHQRLQTFAGTCDTLVILPGGFGTLHELMDFIVPKQWGLIDKTIILINLDHYWDHLLSQFRVMVENNALKQKHLDLLIVTPDIDTCMKEIQNQGPATQHVGLNDRYWEKNGSNDGRCSILSLPLPDDRQ